MVADDFPRLDIHHIAFRRREIVLQEFAEMAFANKANARRPMLARHFI
jgi:hypothetical protein